MQHSDGIGSEFGVNSMNAWIHPTSIRLLLLWWCNGMWDHFLALFWPLRTNRASFKATAYLNIVVDHENAAISQSSNHHRLVSWTWEWVHFTQMTSTVTRSQSNRAPLGCGGTGDSLHGCAADKSAATAWYHYVNIDQNLWGMFPGCQVCKTKLAPLLITFFYIVFLVTASDAVCSVCVTHTHHRLKVWYIWQVLCVSG